MNSPFKLNIVGNAPGVGNGITDDSLIIAAGTEHSVTHQIDFRHFCTQLFIDCRLTVIASAEDDVVTLHLNPILGLAVDQDCSVSGDLCDAVTQPEGDLIPHTAQKNGQTLLLGRAVVGAQLHDTLHLAPTGAEDYLFALAGEAVGSLQIHEAAAHDKYGVTQLCSVGIGGEVEHGHDLAAILIHTLYPGWQGRRTGGHDDCIIMTGQYLLGSGLLGDHMDDQLLHLYLVVVDEAADVMLKGKVEGSLVHGTAQSALFVEVHIMSPDTEQAGRLHTGRAARRKQSLLRVMLLYVCVFSIPFWVLFFLAVCLEYTGLLSILWVGISAVLMLVIARNVLEIMFNAVTHGSSMFYDRLAGTHVAYNRSKLTSLFGIRVVDIKPLTAENIGHLTRQTGKALKRFDPELVRDLVALTESILLDWLASGLEDTLCELRLDKHFGRKAVMLSIHGPDKTMFPASDSHAALHGALGLELKTYYAAGKNICIIHIPKDEAKD